MSILPSFRPASLAAPVLAALVAVLTLAAAPAALACMCTPPPPPEEALSAADAVFAGQVVAVERSERKVGSHALPQRLVTLEIKAAWKGLEGEDEAGKAALKRQAATAEKAGKPAKAASSASGATATVWTGLGGGDCGYDFEEGKSYLVYASRLEDGSLTTGICTRTRPLDRAQDDLEVLAAAEGGR